MAKFKPSLLTLALAAAGLSSSILLPTVYAQEVEQQSQEQVAENNDESESDEEAGEEHTIVITGFKGSLIRSLDEKRYADTITEQLSSDDLGALPDVSIADALTRLPGVAAIRTGGKASEINIRGLSGIFVHTTLNGREQVSTSGSRSVEFAQYPSELINAATVYKSQKASLIEGGVAGTVDLKTISPLAMKEDHAFSMNLRGTYNDRADEIYDAESSGNRFSLSYKGKFADDTLGVAAGYSRLFQPSVATQFIGLAYNAQVDVDNVINDLEGPENNPAAEYMSEGFEMQHKGGESTRDGFVGVIEWAPNSDFILKADTFISKFDEKAFARGFRVKFDSSTANIANPVIDDNAVIGADLTRGRIGSNTRVELVNDNNIKVDDVENFGLNAQWNLTEQFTLVGDLSYSAATSDFQNGLLWGLVAEDANAASPVLDGDVAISYRLNGLDLPSVGFNQNFTDLNKVMLSKYGVYPYQFDDDIKAIRFDGIYETRDNDIFSSYEMGVRYSERNYQAKRSVFEYGADNRFSSRETPLRLTSDMASVVNFEGEFSHFPSYLAIDYNAALNAWFPNGIPQPITTFGVNSAGEIDYHSDWSVRQSGQVWEDVLSGYFVANIDTEINDVPLTGNFGVRVISTDQSSTKLVDVGGDETLGAQYITDEAGLVSDRFAPSVEGIKYTDVLPQLNLNFRITDNSQIRFSGARVMARTQINRLIADFNIRYDEDDGEAHVNSTNSPLLKPFLADQYDLSYEYYFDDTDGAIVFAVFRKDLKSFVQEFT
ncbi:MAG: TonB-dependent receptor, partial [Kangiellaceae bacterium]|nr:TonB-dependent receptor [Kangiellaceae bacterium]